MCRFFDDASGNWSDGGVNSSVAPAEFESRPMADVERRAELRSAYNASGQRDQYGADELIVCMTEHLTDFAAYTLRVVPVVNNTPVPYNYSVVPYMGAVVPNEGAATADARFGLLIVAGGLVVIDAIAVSGVMGTRSMSRTTEKSVTPHAVGQPVLAGAPKLARTLCGGAWCTQLWLGARAEHSIVRLISPLQMHMPNALSRVESIQLLHVSAAVALLTVVRDARGSHEAPTPAAAIPRQARIHEHARH
jgi:hypothetical protein